EEGQVTEQSFDGKTYYLGGRGKETYWFPSNRVLVFAPSKEAMEKCLALPAKPQRGPLDDALEVASKKKSQFVVGINLPKQLMEEGRQQLKQGGGMLFTSLLEFNTAHMTMAVKEDIDWEVTLSFPDKDKAKAAKETISSLISMVKIFLPTIEEAMRKQ